MPLVMNCLEEENHTVVFGKHFSFKPLQVKTMQENIAHYFATDRTDMGFTTLPDECEDPEFKASPAGVEIVAAKRKEGIERYVQRLRGIIYNAQVSLKHDLERANIKSDPRSWASEGELKALGQLVKYQTSKDDADQRRIDKFKELEKKVKEI